MAVTEKLLTARVFIHDKFTYTEADAVKDSDEIPGTGWTQIFTKGDVTLSFARETVAVGNDQQGDTKVYQTGMPTSVTIPFSEYGFDVLSEYAKLDPNIASGATAFDIADNKGVEISGMSLLIYSKDTDSENETDTPDPTSDNEAYVIYNGVVDSSVDVAFNNDQGVVELTFNCVAFKDSNSTSADGKKGRVGTFTVA